MFHSSAISLLIRPPGNYPALTQSTGMSRPDLKPDPTDRGAEFSTTHWSVVLEAGQGDSPAASEALEYLCRCYWYPVYVFVRRKGHSPADAQDLAQQFFARFLERKYVALADQSRGKFRTFLV